MKRILISFSFLLFVCIAVAQSSKNIPCINGKRLKNEASDKMVVKEPKVHFTSKEEKVYAVVQGTIRMVSNFNVVIESDGKYFIYQDVKGVPEQLNKEVKRGDEIGTMYFNEDKKLYGLFISVMTAPKKYLSYEEIVKAIKG
ncbi:MAG: hypothetical protein JSS78_02720 [Bacteroidetes bacterium]|nr:hypothetical protein [Bacteroidota bacterium]